MKSRPSSERLPGPVVEAGPRYIVCVPGLAENLNSIGSLWNEFGSFGEIVGMQENRKRGYALIEFADLYAAFKVVSARRSFFSNEFIRPFFAVPLDEAALEVVKVEHARRKAYSEELERQKREPPPRPPQPPPPSPRLDDKAREKALLNEMIRMQEEMINLFEATSDEAEQARLKTEIDSMSSVIDVLAQRVIHA